jgi:hypothetical protein
MSRDSAARPHQLLKLKIKDLMFKLTPDIKQYAEILVNGKTGTRHIPLIDSIPKRIIQTISYRLTYCNDLFARSLFRFAGGY